MTLNYIISEGEGRGIIEMRISRENVETTAESLLDDEVTLDGETYKLSPYFDFSGVNIGAYYTWYIDCNDVVSFAKQEKLYVYAYLNWVYRNEDDDSVMLKMYTENARWVELAMRDKIKFNGEMTSAETIYNNFGRLPSGYRQLVTYRVNSAAKIVELNTAKIYDAWSTQEKEATENGVFRARKISSAQYRTSICAFGTDAYLTDKRLIFFIPNQSDGSTDENGFMIGNNTNLVVDQAYSGYAYDCDKTGGAPVCVLSASYIRETVDDLSSLMVVKKVTKTVNADNEKVYEIKGMYKGYEVEITTSADGSFPNIENLEFGDVIQFSTNTSGEMSIYKRKFDYSADYGKTTYYNGAAYHNYTIAGGTIYDIDAGNNMMVLQTASKVMFSFLSGCTYYLVDTANQEITTTDISDVTKGRYVVAKAQYFRTREVVIYI
jgi:hypothetical protein